MSRARTGWSARRVGVAVMAALLASLLWVGSVGADSDDESGGLSPEKQAEGRAKVQKVVDETLKELFEVQPKAREALAKSDGYAVFSNFGMKILVAGGGTGKGLAVDQTTGAKTYMKMVELQAGLGMGVKKFRVVWVFNDQSDFEHFINQGWELGGQATAAAKLNDDGGAMQGALSVKDGVWIYQLTGDGLALELTLKGTKYYKDKKLN